MTRIWENQLKDQTPSPTNRRERLNRNKSKIN